MLFVCGVCVRHHKCFGVHLCGRLHVEVASSDALSVRAGGNKVAAVIPQLEVMIVLHTNKFLEINNKQTSDGSHFRPSSSVVELRQQHQ